MDTVTLRLIKRKTTKNITSNDEFFREAKLPIICNGLVRAIRIVEPLGIKAKIMCHGEQVGAINLDGFENTFEFCHSHKYSAMADIAQGATNDYLSKNTNESILNFNRVDCIWFKFIDIFPLKLVYELEYINISRKGILLFEPVYNYQSFPIEEPKFVEKTRLNNDWSVFSQWRRVVFYVNKVSKTHIHNIMKLKLCSKFEHRPIKFNLYLNDKIVSQSNELGLLEINHEVTESKIIPIDIAKKVIDYSNGSFWIVLCDDVFPSNEKYILEIEHLVVTWKRRDSDKWETFFKESAEFNPQTDINLYVGEVTSKILFGKDSFNALKPEILDIPIFPDIPYTEDILHEAERNAKSHIYRERLKRNIEIASDLTVDEIHILPELVEVELRKIVESRKGLHDEVISMDSDEYPPGFKK